MGEKSKAHELEQRLSNIINTRCNTVGCKNCDLKFGGFDSAECAATDLQNRILDLEMSHQ